MSFDEVVFYIFLTVTFLGSVDMIIKGLRMLLGFDDRSSYVPLFVKWFLLIRGVIFLGLVYLWYQLFFRQILGPISITLIATVVGFISIGLSYLVGKRFDLKDPEEPVM